MSEMSGRLPNKLQFDNWHWMGTNLAHVFAAMDVRPGSMTEETIGMNAVMMYHAAMADAEEMMKKKQYQGASNSYHVAIVATKLANIVGLREFLDLVSSYAESLMKQKLWLEAFKAALATTEIEPEYVEGYMLMSMAMKGEGNDAVAASFLLRGMEQCRDMCDADVVRFIVECSQLLGKAFLEVQADPLKRAYPPKDLLDMVAIEPTIPKTSTVWTSILSKLAEQQGWVGMALVTVGLGGVLPRICGLVQACPTQVDCSSIHVEELYESLSPRLIKQWGDALALFIIVHKGNVGKRSRDPLAVHLTKLAIKYGTCELLRWMLRTPDAESFDLDSADRQGDTALHVLAKMSPIRDLHEEMIKLLVMNGASPNVVDRAGKKPHEYLPSKFKRTISFLVAALKTPTEGFRKRIDNLKKDGNQAHRAKNGEKARHFYWQAITAIESSSYEMPHDLAVLYNNMATVCASMNDHETAFTMAETSAQLDPSYHKPYWRLGKSLMERKEFVKACDKFLLGMGSEQADADQKMLFIQEVCSMLTSLAIREADPVLKRLKPHLIPCWPHIVESLSRSASWETIRLLVLGPPEEKVVDQSLVQAGWKFADTYKEGKQKVGYAMALKASSAALHSLVEQMELSHPTDRNHWVTDLVLALLLQGVSPASLLPEDEATTWYHIVLFLCCVTEKLGLMRYILSDDARIQEARRAENGERRTLLHAVCLHFGDGEHEVGRQLVTLLLDKGVNPAATDVMAKKAVDYVAPHSPVYEMLVKPPDEGPKTTEEMKERGNAEYKKKNYTEAIKYYTQALTVLRKKLPANILMFKGHDAKKHELAVLFSNRSECHLQLGHVEDAFSDAKDSVSFDGHWYRGHIRVGRALLRKNKAQSAIKAFSNAFNALGMDATEAQKKEILKELVRTVTTQLDKLPDRIPNLGYVSGDLWAKISYDFFCSGNQLAEVTGPNKSNDEWKIGQYCFQQFMKTQIPLHNLPRIELNLKPLCSWQMDKKVAENVVELILFFLQCGTDHTTLSFYPGDSYIHAAAILTVLNANRNVLDWTMQHLARVRHEENLQDWEGNTALHLFAAPDPHRIPPPPLPVRIRQDLCEILIWWGVNPKVQNKRGQMAVDCVEKKNKHLHDFLMKVTEKASEPRLPKMATPTTTTSGSTATNTEATTHNSAKSQPPKQQPQEAGGGGAAAAASANGGRTANSRTAGGQPKGNNSNGNQRLQCNLCQDILAEARDFFSRDKSRIGYSKLVSLLGYKHQRDSRHDKFVMESLDLIVKELGKSLSPDVPEVILKMSQAHLHKVLEKLASQDRWRQMQVVVEKARSIDVPRGNFAKNMSVLSLLRDKGLCGAEAQRLQILNLLLSHGAQLGSSQMKESMEVTIQHGEWRLVERLLEVGVEPRFITLDKHDTPLHAALGLALDRDKGNNFSLFEQLVALYEKEPEKYPYLDIRCTDKNSNTLLHVACQAHYSKHSHRAVELLVSKDVPVDVKNSEGRTAIDYLKTHDRRTQYLKVAGKQSGVTSKRKDDPNKQQTASAAPLESAQQESKKNGDGGDNEGTREEPPPAAQRLQVDTPGFRAKDAIVRLTSLVEGLSELTPGEAKRAKSSKGKWLEIGRPLRRQLTSDSEAEDEEQATPKAAGASDLPTASGDAQPAERSPQDSDEEEEEEEEKSGDSEDLDLLTFDNLDWEVECTAEVWKTLRDQRVPYDLKQRIFRSIQFLASGEWRPQLCRKVRGVPDSLNLHQAKFVKGARILWELAIAFSPRLSETAEKRIEEDERKGEFAVRGGRMYTEIIRVWDIVFHYDKMRPAVHRIIQSHERGERCLIRKELKGVSSQQFQGGATRKRHPVLYSEAEVSEEVRTALQREHEGKLQLCPPASASEMEFHILKFYCFSSTLVYNVLKNLEMKIDFPFRVTDREHAVINLQSQAPILLLGRSGTGKTTCCLYRLWSRFLTYWTKSKEMDYAAWLPRTVHFVVEDDSKDDNEEEDGEEDDPNAELFSGLLEKDVTESSKGRAPAAAAAAAAASHLQHPPAATNSAENDYEEGDDGYEEEDEGEGEEGEEEEEEEMAAAFSSHVQYDHLHQLFVTKNQVLCSEVQKNFRELCHADEVAQHHVAVEEAALPHRLQDVDEYKFPLFLTSRQLILILDASLPPPYFFERNEDGSLRVTIHGWGADEEIFAFVPLEDDSDEEEEEEYNEEGDQEGESKEGSSQPAADHHPRKKDNRREVTYSVFAHEVWPKIIKKAQVNYHPSLVWTEIMSFIKGSFASLTQPKGYLDQESYEQLGRKQAPNFTGSRHKVYELFQRYTDYKRQHGLYDEADLVFNIYKRLKTLGGPMPWVLHEVFVDETQDFTQAELTVLIRLAHSPNDMFLTGDTAQSIMRGVSFRFSDLKTLFHYAKQTLKARGKTGMLEVPRQVYQLTHNYRSHAGILSLASAVLDLLVEFFPESFDRLEKDQGLFDGPQPVVLESGSPADLAILLSGNKRKTSHIEFGAHQVILVVNEEARDNLPEELGMGLVLTIYEAKGLEFDDVLLYNFFKDSEANKEWRVVTEYLERLSKKEVCASSSTSGLVEIDEDLLRQSGRPRPLNFDPNLHKILNSELKHLYTAVTRARVNVWIFDQDSEKRAPMFEYFKARKLVKIVSMREGADDTGVSEAMFAEKSTPEEWEKRGDEIMLRSLYDVAAKCYAMAGASRKQNIAIAHQRALKASHLRAQPRQMRDEFLKASIMFLECHKDQEMSSSTLALRYNLVMKAGRCLQNARENHLAALVFEKNGQPEVAAPLYLRARKWLAASQCYEHVDNFGRALKILDEQELYDQAIDCLQRYNFRKQDLERKGHPLPRVLIEHKPEGSFTVASLSYKAAKFYHRYGEMQKMLAAIERLPNKEDQIKFLQKHGFLQDAAQLMKSDGRIGEATRMMLQNGQVDKAMKIAEEGSDSSLKAQCYLFKAQRLLDSAASRWDKQQAAKAQEDKTATSDIRKGEATDPVTDKQTSAQSSKKVSPSKAGKKKDAEMVSSDDEVDSSSDDNQQQVITEFLERACQQFDMSKDYSGMGECQLLLAELCQDKATLLKSFDIFNTAQPVANHTGMLECVHALYKMSAGGNLDFNSCGRLIWGVEKVFDAVRILLQPSTVEDKNRYQLFLSYYGLERSGEEKLVFYPKLKPRFVRMMPKKYVFASKEEKKEEKVYRTASDLVNPLAHYLIERTKEWCERVQSYLKIHLPSVMHCATFQEGRGCEDRGNCPFLHSIYTQEMTNDALKLLSSQVRLDHALQAGAESLKSIDIMLSELTMTILQQEHMWSSVEQLLDFIFPAGLVTYNMSSVLEFCLSVARKSPVYSGVHLQMERYLQYLWRNPGRVGKGKSQNVLKERCKSTAWMVLASLLVPLFKLNIQVDACCKQVEIQLDKERPEWVFKRHKYALLTDQRMVIFLARRHLDALRFLQPDNFDPFEALIKFTKFVRLLLDRREISLFPDMSIFLFWMEVFVTLAVCLAAKLRKNGNLFLPGCYPRLLKLFNLTLPSAQRGDLWRMMEQFKPRGSQTLCLLHDRIEVLGLMLYGKQQSAFCLLNHLLNPKKMRSNTFQLAERSVVLALTLLVNVEQGNVPTFCETPIMQCFLGIQLSDNSMIPPRLARLIAQVQEAISYSNIVDSLNNSLSALKERAGFFQWRWNEHKAEGLMPLGPANVHAGGPFRHFRPEVLQGDGQGHLGEVPDAMDEIDDVDQRRNMEEEEEIDEEEKAVFQQQVDEAKKEEQKNKAVRVLVRCFRHIRFQKRLKTIRINYLHQSEEEMFSPFTVTDKMCAICGVSFEVSESTAQGPDTEKGGEEEEEAEDEGAVMARMKQEHVNSDQHRFINREFETFRTVYRQFIVMPLMEIGAYLTKMQVRKQRDTWYKDLVYQVDTVLEKIDTLQQQLDQALQNRSWRNRQNIIEQCHQLGTFYLKNVQDPVHQRFEMHQKQQMETAAAKEAEKQHQEKLMDGMMEEPSMADILNVVDQPMYGAGPNAQGGRGVAGGYRGRGRGRGPGGAGRGRGRGDRVPRSQGQWVGGYRNQGPVGDGQFEKGDLPPRFRRN